MRSLNLMLHSGGTAVDRETVNQVVTPRATKSWVPVAHGRLVDSLYDILPSYDLKIVEASHGLGHDGDRYFGLFQVASTVADSDYAMVFGLRNSHDKSFPAGICLGSGVFVCDNLSFSGEVNLGRKHTRFIERDLPSLFATSVGRLMSLRTQQDTRFEA